MMNGDEGAEGEWEAPGGWIIGGGWTDGQTNRHSTNRHLELDPSHRPYV